METNLGAVESRFADIVWENEPLTTRELVNICAEELNWKRTTTYTVLKKLCLRGIFDMQKKTVRALVTKDEFRAMRTENFLRDNFQGSLPAFVAAFTSRQNLSQKDLAELKNLIDSIEE